ncbi:MAG: hypothetical protein KGP06_00805 [Acidobacteria bacterium]|nr:hypothetical protein [Acidobacteriota bacterium]
MVTDRLVSFSNFDWNLESHKTYTNAPISAKSGISHQISADTGALDVAAAATE